MFRFGNLEENNNNDNNGVQTPSKSVMYKILQRDFILPDIDARCTTKAYLARVQAGEVWRVRREQLLQFESGLTIEEQTKSSFFHIGVMKLRLERFMALSGVQEFGFPVGTNPDELWFSRVLRYLDPSNILAAFRTPVRNSPLPRNLPGRM